MGLTEKLAYPQGLHQAPVPLHIIRFWLALGPLGRLQGPLSGGQELCVSSLSFGSLWAAPVPDKPGIPLINKICLQRQHLLEIRWSRWYQF